MVTQIDVFPSRIEVVPCHIGFVAKLDEYCHYFPDLETLAKAVNPKIRKELVPLETFAGSC